MVVYESWKITNYTIFSSWKKYWFKTSGSFISWTEALASCNIFVIFCNLKNYNYGKCLFLLITVFNSGYRRKEELIEGIL